MIWGCRVFMFISSGASGSGSVGFLGMESQGAAF